MSKKKGKAMINPPKHYIYLIEELQKKNNELRTQLEIKKELLERLLKNK